VRAAGVPAPVLAAKIGPVAHRTEDDGGGGSWERRSAPGLSATVGRDGALARSVAELAAREGWKLEELHTEEGDWTRYFGASPSRTPAGGGIDEYECEQHLAIAKRELVGYFASPVAYVFLVIYLLLAGFFTFTVRPAFFDFGQASLITFFRWQPWLFLFLVPAVGMRLWSEERRLGTIELLLTMPVTAWQAIVGKFVASWLFPDPGVVPDLSGGDHGELPGRSGQRGDLRELHRVRVAGRVVSGDQLHDLGLDAQPGRQFHPGGGAVSVSDPGRVSAGDGDSGELVSDRRWCRRWRRSV
jgi:hypothetical protein